MTALLSKRLVWLLLWASLAAPAVAQSLAPRPSFSMMGLYQRYTLDGTTLAEASMPIHLVVPLGTGFVASLATTPALASGEAVADLGGMTDVQAGLSYTIELGNARMALSLRSNVPSGKSTLNAEEFSTAWQLSQSFYEFQVPGFGQGFNIGPGLLGAFPITEDFVIGLGVSYQYRGAYTPVEGGLGAYDPGDEFFFVGGLDYRFNPQTSVSLDLTYTLYGTDELADGRTFEAGNKLTAAVQLRRLFGFHEGRLALRYRAATTSNLAVDGVLLDELQTVPSRGDLRAAVMLRLAPDVSAELLLHGRYYDATADFDRQTVLDIGLSPHYEVNDQLTVRSRFVYTTGTFGGLEGGLGLAVRL
ncbi:hypothetical protein AWN76_001380 [Rhodothermaceae bacterium RA]|nr:hypothetical protein AWN76_001380 [Rhodothermaceae bacterium RA]